MKIIFVSALRFWVMQKYKEQNKIINGTESENDSVSSLVLCYAMIEKQDYYTGRPNFVPATEQP